MAFKPLFYCMIIVALHCSDSDDNETGKGIPCEYRLPLLLHSMNRRRRFTCMNNAYQSGNKPLKPRHLSALKRLVPVWLWYLILDHFYYGPKPNTHLVDTFSWVWHFSTDQIVHFNSSIPITIVLYRVAFSYTYFFSLHFFPSLLFSSPSWFLFCWALESTWKTKPKWLARNRILCCGPSMHSLNTKLRLTFLKRKRSVPSFYTNSMAKRKKKKTEFKSNFRKRTTWISSTWIALEWSVGHLFSSCTASV